jgi:hypothetical protein
MQNRLVELHRSQNGSDQRWIRERERESVQIRTQPTAASYSRMTEMDVNEARIDYLAAFDRENDILPLLLFTRKIVSDADSEGTIEFDLNKIHGRLEHKLFSQPVILTGSLSPMLTRESALYDSIARLRRRFPQVTDARKVNRWPVLTPNAGFHRRS